MAKTIVGLFDTFAEAQDVVQDLIDNGFRREDISVISRDNDSEREVGEESGAAEGAGTGAVGGTVLGGALGLLVGAGLLTIPGIGPVLAAGPLAAGIGTAAATVGAGALGAGLGAATGGLIGGLVGAGVPKEHAEYYAEGVRRGGTLVTVAAEDAMAVMAHETLVRHGAINIEDRSSQWRSEGWSNFDEDTEPSGYAASVSAADTMRRPYSVEHTSGPLGSDSGHDYDYYDNDYRNHYQRTFSSAGYTYEDYKPVYQYGHSLANDPRYVANDWNNIEGEARGRWEEHNPGTWEQFKDSIHYAWDKARGKR